MFNKMASQFAIKTGLQTPQQCSGALAPLLFITFRLERRVPRKMLPTDLTIPALPRGAEEGDRAFLAAPRPLNCQPVSPEVVATAAIVASALWPRRQEGTVATVGS